MASLYYADNLTMNRTFMVEEFNAFTDIGGYYTEDIQTVVDYWKNMPR